MSNFMKVDYPFHFINSVVNDFPNSKEGGDENFIILTSLLEITKTFIYVEIPYFKPNEIK